MKGSIFYQKDRERWAISWHHENKNWTVTRYKGEFMYHRKIAEKCLATIQGDYENYCAGLAPFRMEKYTRKGWTDVVEFYEEWLKEVIEPRKKPATYKGYKSYLKNWIKPFFSQKSLMLHEIQLDSLNKFLNFVKLSGKGKLNVMMALHSMMDYAWRSKRIPEMPPFPKREEYNIIEPDFHWLPEDLQMEIIETIPEEHRPIFLWLKYHYRRPGEACALQWQDYDEVNRAFIIRRTISARKLVDSTKTKSVSHQPCDPRFYPILKQLRNKCDGLPTGFIFQNPRARRVGKRYTNESLNNIWRAACKEVGIKIPLYHGIKHSSCSQFINEKGGNIDELQVLTDHRRRDSVLKYTRVGLGRKLDLMQRRKVEPLDYYKTTTK